MLTNWRKRRVFVFFALVVVLGFIAVAPFFNVINQQIMFWLMGVCGLLAVVALWARSWFDLILTLFLMVVFALAWKFFPNMDQRILAIRVCALTGFFILNLVLLIGPWSRFSRTIEKVYKHRRHLGVTDFLLGLSHFSLLFGPYFDNSFANAFASFFTFELCGSLRNSRSPSTTIAFFRKI